MAETIKIGGELESVATGGIVAAASAIKDKTKNKTQEQVNAETDETLAAHSSAISGFEGGNFLTLVATDADADIAEVFTRLSVTPAVNIIYRIANWKHNGADTKYNTAYYSEYAANGTTTADLVPISVENKGIDDVPTAESENLIKSGGVQNELALGAVYDVSAKNPTAGPNSDGKFTLEYILNQNNVNTLIPTAVRKGGMSIKFVQSSDNKYVQFRCIADEFTTDTTQWYSQNADDDHINEELNNKEIELEHKFDIDSPDTDKHSVRVKLYSHAVPIVQVEFLQGYSSTVQMPLECVLYDKDGEEITSDRKLLYDGHYTRTFEFGDYSNIEEVEIKPYGGGIADIGISITSQGSVNERITTNKNAISNLVPRVSTLESSDIVLSNAIFNNQIQTSYQFDRQSPVEARHKYSVPFFSLKTPIVTVEWKSGNGMGLECTLYDNDHQLIASDRKVINNTDTTRTFVFEDYDNIHSIEIAPYSDGVTQVDISITNSDNILAQINGENIRLSQVEKTLYDKVLAFSHRFVTTWTDPTHPSIITKDFKANGKIEIYVSVASNGRLIVSALDDEDNVVATETKNIPYADYSSYVFVFNCECSKIKFEGTNYDFTADITIKNVADYQEFKRSHIKKTISDVDNLQTLNIAYSGDLGLGHQNSLEHFIAAAKLKFNSLKADMQLTSDLKVFLCHDTGVTVNNNIIQDFDSQSNTPISSINSETLMGYTYADGTTPCLLEDFLYVCKKYGKIPFLTLRAQNNAVKTAEVMYAALQKFRMVNNAIINLYPFSILNVNAINLLPVPMRTNRTLDNDSTYLTQSILDDCVIKGVESVDLYPTPMAAVTDELLLYAASKNIKVYGVVFNSTQYENASKKGIQGFQIYNVDCISDL